MGNEYESNFDDMLDEQYYNYLIQKDNYVLTEQDFYPPSDDRTFKSVVEDVLDGDNFAEYCKDFFELLEEENYYD